MIRVQRAVVGLAVVLLLLTPSVDAQKKGNRGNLVGAIALTADSDVTLGGTISFAWSCTGNGCAEYEILAYTHGVFEVFVRCLPELPTLYGEWTDFSRAVGNTFVLGEPSSPLLTTEWADVGGPATCEAFLGYPKFQGGGSVFIALASTTFVVP